MSNDNHKKIYITEDQVRVLSEGVKEVTFWRFFLDIKTFLGKLLKGDVNADISDSLKTIGLTRNSLVNKLLNCGVLKRKEDIREYTDEDGKEKSRYYVKYSVAIPHFRKKILDLYDKVK